MTNKAKWFSLAEALESYKPAEVATAIERDGIWVVDRFGRKINAGDSEASDAYSRQFALDLVSARHGELQNPGPEYSWESERWDVETHPTYTFGWPAESVPIFSRSDEDRPEKKVPWTKRSIEEFVEEKKSAGSYRAAGKLHNVSRQNYTRVYKRVTGE